MIHKLGWKLTHLIPVLSSLLFGVLCAFLIESSTLEAYPVTPFSEENSGSFSSFGNAFYFVILAGIGATFVYLLLKRRRHRLITVITGFALATAISMLSTFYLFAVFSRFDVFYAEALTLSSAATITVSAVYAVFRGSQKISSLVVLGVGGALGTFLGFSIPTTSVMLILGFLAVYDIFAVYRGPVGKIASTGLENLRGLSFSFADLQMGLGDLTFYSMLSGHMFLSFGFVSWLTSIVGILIGCLLSFKMLEKREMFPGLPFPIFLGLTAGLFVINV